MTIDDKAKSDDIRFNVEYGIDLLLNQERYVVSSDDIRDFERRVYGSIGEVVRGIREDYPDATIMFQANRYFGREKK